MIVVAENLTVTSPGVARALEERDPEPIRRVARGAAGASYLDVNLGRGAGPGDLSFVLDVLEECWAGGILIDTARTEPMEQAARTWRGELVLNGFSGDAGREGVLEVAERHGLPVVVFLMAGGVPREADERLALAAELVGRCRERGIGPERVWIDPVVVPLGWQEGQAYNAALLEVLRRLPEVFGEPVSTLVGLSNLTSGAAGPRKVPWLQEVFLAAAAGAGLTHAMIDVTRPALVRTVRALEVLENRRLYAPEEFRDGAGKGEA